MTPHDQQTRHRAVSLHLDEGVSMLEVSRRLRIAYRSVRTWVKRYKAQGEQGLIADYSTCGSSTRLSKKVIDKAIYHKGKHPEWGAPFILIKLEDEFPDEPLPGARYLQKIFLREGLNPKRTRLPGGDGDWAAHVFDRVQVDAKECLRTADGADCCYMNYVDEHSGSELDAFVFPLRPYL